MVDSGANLVVSNMATATNLGLEIFDYDKPITINFGGVKNVECRKYCDLGEILGKVAIVENLPKTLVPIIPFLDKGLAVIYMKDFCLIVSKSGEIITEAQQQQDGLFYFDLEPIVRYKENRHSQNNRGESIQSVRDLIKGLTIISASESNNQSEVCQVN